MIPVCRDEIPTHPAGTDFTLRLHGEINFHPGKAGQVTTWCLFTKTIDSQFKNIYKMTKFYKDICLLFSDILTCMRRKDIIEITTLFVLIFAQQRKIFFAFTNFCATAL